MTKVIQENLIAKVFTKSLAATKDQELLYKFYLDVWKDTWRELNVSPGGLQDDYMRFDYRVGLYKDGEPIAFHGYSTFNLANTWERSHSYFSKLGVPLAEELLNKGIKKLATLEYMAVHPDFRRVSDQFVGEILGGFSTQYFSNSPYDAVMTVARNNRSVNKMCKMYGAQPAYENLALHNVEVDVMIFDPKNIQLNPQTDVQATIQGLLDQVQPSRKLKVA